MTLNAKWQSVKAICDAAMPGPWQWASDTLSFGHHLQTRLRYDEPTCQFIAAARTTLPEAIAWIERAVTVLQEALDPAGDPHWGCVADQLIREVTA